MLQNIQSASERPGRVDFCPSDEGKTGAVHRCIHSIIHLIDDHAKSVNIPVRKKEGLIGQQRLLI